jgi:hypothetical protein
MFEESPDGFISRWRDHAASVRIFSRTEGLPLIECQAGGAILQMLERTGPYLAPPGAAKVIINPTARQVEVKESGEKQIEATGIGRVRVTGTITRRDDPFLVVDAGAPLVVGVEEPLPPEAVPGAWVWFDAVPPIHGFVLREARTPVLRGADGEAI